METRFSVLLYLSKTLDFFVQISVLMTFHLEIHVFSMIVLLLLEIFLSPLSITEKKSEVSWHVPIIGETLYPTRVGVAFCRYNKYKPAEYGLLFRIINSGEIMYTYTSVIYAGKPINQVHTMFKQLMIMSSIWPTACQGKPT